MQNIDPTHSSFVISSADDYVPFRERLANWRAKGWKELLIGSYDYKFLCMPRWNPWSSKGYFSAPPFFRRDAFLSLTLALIMGLQHSMAMIGGIVTPPRLVYTEVPRDTNKEQYLVSAALIVSGLCTLVQVSRVTFFGGRYAIGTGLLSVMGVSFTFLPIAQAAIAQQIQYDGKTWDEAYGAVLGTYALCALAEVIIALFPPRWQKRMFSSTVCGITVFLIGVKLTGAGMANWGGGAFCGDNAKGILPPSKIANCYVQNVTTGVFTNATCYNAPVKPLCTANGFVKLPFGSPEYVGMGLTVVVFMTFIELFGSPFLRNINVLLSLFFGCFISGVVKVDGHSYWDNAIINNAPGITFIWTTVFPLKIYPPVILPAIIGYVICALECVADITATEEGGREPTSGPEHDRHVQGGMMADALNSIFATLATTTPVVTFAQNNGIIVLTRCAARAAGYSCAFWLILSGVIAKFGAFFVAIPACVLGGMTTFLFANVAVSGIKVMCMNGLPRRERYIALVSLGVGIGVIIYPGWATNNLWPITPGMSQTVVGLRNGIIILLSTPYCIGGLVGILLHFLMPMEASDAELAAKEKSTHSIATDASYRKGDANSDDNSPPSTEAHGYAVTVAPTTTAGSPTTTTPPAPVAAFAH